MENKTVGFFGGKFLPFHLGHAYVILSASNQVDELYVILSSSKKRDKEACERDGIKYIPADVRLSWLGEFANDLENIKVIHVEDDQGDEDYDWKQGAKVIKEAIGKPIDFVFSSESKYDEIFKKYYPKAKHVVIDEKRNAVNISATEIRRDLYAHWDKLPNCVRGYFAKRVAIIGTESTGKSTLVKKLAKYYNTNYVHEVGRDYCKKYSNLLTEEMFNFVAMEHALLQRKKAEESNKVLFVDSDATVTQYYLDMYFRGKKSPLIEEAIKLQNYDLVIYLEPDLPWIADGYRFAGEQNQRIENNDRLKRMYQERGIKFEVVKGSYTERFNRARELIDNMFKNSKLDTGGRR